MSSLLWDKKKLKFCNCLQDKSEDNWGLIVDTFPGFFSFNVSACLPGVLWLTSWTSEGEMEGALSHYLMAYTHTTDFHSWSAPLTFTIKTPQKNYRQHSFSISNPSGTNNNNQSLHFQFQHWSSDLNLCGFIKCCFEMLLQYSFGFSQYELFVLGNGVAPFDIQGEYPVGPHIVSTPPWKRF